MSKANQTQILFHAERLKSCFQGLFAWALCSQAVLWLSRGASKIDLAIDLCHGSLHPFFLSLKAVLSPDGTSLSSHQL